MPKSDLKSGLPPAAGSPFRTKNFNKFFFGIIIAALILVAIFFAFFYHAAKSGGPSEGAPSQHSLLRTADQGCLSLLS